MANSTKIRGFSRLIDKASTPLWVIGPDDRLVFLSAAVGDWLTVDPETLVGRKCLAGSSVTDDPLDFLAASLAAPPGFTTCGTASLFIQPTLPGVKSRRIAGMDVRFVRLGTADDAVTLAVGGVFVDPQSDPTVEAAVQLRQQLDGWRNHHRTLAEGVVVGTSRAATRVQNQVRLAEAVRSDVLISSPPGCFSESLAISIHSRSAAGEASVTIDGPLMDAELLDASLATAIAHLADNDRNTATAIVKEMDQTPPDAQSRLAEHLKQFGKRLRLIAICGATPKIATKEETSEADRFLSLDQSAAPGVIPELADRLCGLAVQIEPLAGRVTDLPLIATAILDRRRAGGDGKADRYSRAALDAMVLYPWPDNFRELDQAIRHAARACRGDVIGPEHFPLAIRSFRPHESHPAERMEIDLDAEVEHFETTLIRETLDACDGNRAEAARRLNISRARLLRKLDAMNQGDST